MAYPMLESALFDKYYYDGQLIDASSDVAKTLRNATDEVTYYETIRILHGCLLFLEDHMYRLLKSISGIEAFDIDIDFISKELRSYLSSLNLGDYEGNMRVVLTKSHTLFHICEANIPSKDIREAGICTNLLKWERVAPNIKVFRGDYKQAVADAFLVSTPYGMPYEVLLEDNSDKIYEGSKSNFFVIYGDKVYSAPDEKILIGITRRRVLDSLKKAGLKLEIGTFSLEQLIKMGEDVALFVSSTPFDILPISSINDIKFNSVNNKNLQEISRIYAENVDEYISKHLV